VTVGSL